MAAKSCANSRETGMRETLRALQAAGGERPVPGFRQRLVEDASAGMAAVLRASDRDARFQKKLLGEMEAAKKECIACRERVDAFEEQVEGLRSLLEPASSAKADFQGASEFAVQFGLVKLSGEIGRGMTEQAVLAACESRCIIGNVANEVVRTLDAIVEEGDATKFLAVYNSKIKPFLFGQKSWVAYADAREAVNALAREVKQSLGARRVLHLKRFQLPRREAESLAEMRRTAGNAMFIARFADSALRGTLDDLLQKAGPEARPAIREVAGYREGDERRLTALLGIKSIAGTQEAAEAARLAFELWVEALDICQFYADNPQKNTAALLTIYWRRLQPLLRFRKEFSSVSELNEYKEALAKEMNENFPAMEKTRRETVAVVELYWERLIGSEPA